MRRHNHLTLHNLSAGISKLGIQKFEAKIGLDNTVSIAMFKKFHFQEVRNNTISVTIARMSA